MKGDYLLGTCYHFFVVTAVQSQHWLQGYFCPPRLEFAYTPQGTIGTFYSPDLGKRSAIHRKKIFDPFEEPYVKVRNRIFTCQRKVNHEQVSHSPTFFD